MGMFDAVLNAATGNLAKEVLDAVKTYLPPDISPEQKAQMELALGQLELQRTQAASAAAENSEKLVNDRIAEYEGTASDLKSIPILGPFMLFLRGSQRVLIGYATVWLDYNVFAGIWNLADPQIRSTFWIANILVLGFLFGERAMQNVMPYVTDFMKAKTGA